ncbi:hypothetical protein G6L58_25050 [Agrobacterium tumefaciens]|uniref:hypothetical protein n=1 Tax=Agrobacterium tumefaciens TaxID=358 RepID=UPI000EF196AB|nr:hypothetical protein At1D1108_49810 [Agrobacterium tumefaciens]NSY93714.1 hypothetical protein [Agrobacterium tumefaciens]
MKNNAAKKQANQQYANDMAAAQQQREWQLEDRDEERAYNRAELNETREYSRQVFSHLVEDAEKAGFNPLTALRAGGGATYNAAAGLAPLSATPLTRQAPVRQAVGGSPVGDAISGFGDFMSNFDPFADQKREQEYRLVESQISALNASAMSNVPRGAGSFATGGLERRLSGQGGVLARGGKNKPGEGTLVGGDDPTVSSLGLNNGKYGWFHSPWAPDAEAVETVYGDNEVMSTLGGIGKLAADGFYTVLRNGNAAYHDAKSAVMSDSKVKKAVVRDYNRNFDSMFGSEYRKRVRGN